MRSRLFTLCLSVAAATTASAQGMMPDMHRDISEVQQKFVDLARAIPESAYGWRPTAARSVGEVLLHVASDNYLIPVSMGKPIPAAMGISADDMKTVEVYEKRKLTRNQIIAELEASFTHLHQAFALTTEANMNETIKFFGRDWSRQRTVILTVTHLHEHLGQLIAYGRSNGIAPPWSH